MTKKTLLTLFAIFLLSTVLLVGCDMIVEKPVNEEEYMVLLDVEEVMEKMENKETFNFIFGNDGCPACDYYKKELIKFHKDEDYKFIYMKYDSNTNMDLLQKLMIETLGEDPSSLATPTTYFIVDGELVERVVGAISVEEIKQYSKFYK